MTEKGERSTQPQQHSANLEQETPSEDNDGLPGYSEVSQQPRADPSVGSYSFAPILGMLGVDISQYLLQGAVVSKDGKTVTVTNANLYSDPIALVQFINTQAALPPRPEIRITGIHNVYGENKIDFDVRVNVMHYLMSKPTDAPLNYIKMVEPKELAFRGDATKSTLPHADGGLIEWARIFCRDPSPNKS
jgi:hypothetical protein